MAVRRRFRIRTEGKECRLQRLAYETGALDGLLAQTEISGLRPGLTLLPHPARDRDNRWRSVLDEIGGATLVDVRESLKLLDWEDDALDGRDVRWFIKLARAAIEANLGSNLSSLRSLGRTVAESFRRRHTSRVNCCFAQRKTTRSHFGSGSRT